MTASNVGFANSGMTGQVGGFQNSGVCLQAFPSFLPHFLPALLLAPFFVRVLDSRFSFFAPKPHGNACYAGYNTPSIGPCYLNNQFFDTYLQDSASVLYLTEHWCSTPFTFMIQTPRVGPRYSLKNQSVDTPLQDSAKSQRCPASYGGLV